MCAAIGGDGGVAVRVLDRGPGLSAGDETRLFELYYRAPSTAALAPGAGIGLFVCDQMVRGMGGRMWALPRDGGGAEFGFELPIYEADRDEEGPAGADEAVPRPVEAAAVGH